MAHAIQDFYRISWPKGPNIFFKTQWTESAIHFGTLKIRDRACLVGHGRDPDRQSYSDQCPDGLISKRSQELPTLIWQEILGIFPQRKKAMITNILNRGIRNVLDIKWYTQFQINPIANWSSIPFKYLAQDNQKFYSHLPVVHRYLLRCSGYSYIYRLSLWYNWPLVLPIDSPRAVLIWS